MLLLKFFPAYLTNLCIRQLYLHHADITIKQGNYDGVVLSNKVISFPFYFDLSVKIIQNKKVVFIHSYHMYQRINERHT